MRAYRLMAAVGALALGVGASTSVSANSYLFDFEDGIDQGGSTQIFGLDEYMQGVLQERAFDGGANVRTGNAAGNLKAQWIGSSNTFGSDGIFTTEKKAILDFDTRGRNKGDWHITKISFEWGVFDPTGGRDWGIDVFSDTSKSWTNNIFSVNRVSPGDTGLSGMIDLSSIPGVSDVTRLRFHDNDIFDVGLDNLTIHDNVVPLPPAAWFFVSAVGVIGYLGKRKAKA